MNSDPDLIKDTHEALNRFRELVDRIESAFANNIAHAKHSRENSIALYERARNNLMLACSGVFDAALSSQQDKYFALFWNLADLIELAIDAALTQGSQTSYRQSGSEGGKRSAPRKIAAANSWRLPALEYARLKRAEKPTRSTSEIAKMTHAYLCVTTPDADTIRKFLYKMEREKLLPPKGRLDATGSQVA